MSAHDPIVLVIPVELPSGNELRRRYRHWAVYKRLRALLATEILVSYMDKYEKPVRRRKVRQSVTITIHHKNRRFDDDNAHQAVKPVLDALRDMNFIHNDSRVWIDLHVRQAIDHDHPRTVIEIKDLPKEGT